MKEFKLNLQDIIPCLLWIIVIFITCTFMQSADRFLELTPEVLGKYYNYKLVLISHITTGGGALILGIVQFWGN